MSVAGRSRQKLLAMMIINMLKLYIAMSWRQALRISRYFASCYEVNLLYAEFIFLTSLERAL
jgi:hypothetical protein